MRRYLSAIFRSGFRSGNFVSARLDSVVMALSSSVGLEDSVVMHNVRMTVDNGNGLSGGLVVEPDDAPRHCSMLPAAGARIGWLVGELVD
jgi:hypothetical protein